METPQNAIDLCKRFEGLKLKPYLCPAGVSTIGYGSTRYLDGRRVRLTDPPITEKMALLLLMAELTAAEIGVIKYCPILAMDTWKRGAIMDFVYNLGLGNLQSSTLRRMINQQKWGEVVKQLNKWIWGGGKKLPGLILRRAAEGRYFK